MILEDKTFLPLDPATRILNRPIFFPLSVNGRRLGMRILGMISWEELSLTPWWWADGLVSWASSSSSSSSSSPPDTIAWLFISSVIEISSSGLNERLDIDLGLLGLDNGSSFILNGVSGREGTGEVLDRAFDKGVSSRSIWASKSEGFKVVLRFDVGSAESTIVS